MPNAIKYKTGNITGSLQKSTIALGVTTGSIAGPTATTGWYSGITPSAGKYNIYETSISQNPNIYCPVDDAELIQFFRSKGATGNNRYNTLFPETGLSTKPAPGIITHGTGQPPSNKIDTFPQINLLSMLDDLPTLIAQNPKTSINWATS